MNEPKTDLMVGVVDVVGVENGVGTFQGKFNVHKFASPMKKSLPRLSSAFFQSQSTNANIDGIS